MDSADGTGTTPLHVAALCGHRRAVKSLLSHGASTMRKDCLGRTAAELASMHGHDQLCSLLESFMAAGGADDVSQLGGGGGDGSNDTTLVDESDEAWVRVAPEDESAAMPSVAAAVLFVVRALYDYE
eukprot:SAG11_NODE_14091_length_625_cov_1.517110_1_plen_126_part_01